MRLLDKIELLRLDLGLGLALALGLGLELRLGLLGFQEGRDGGMDVSGCSGVKKLEDI